MGVRGIISLAKISNFGKDLDLPIIIYAKEVAFVLLLKLMQIHGWELILIFMQMHLLLIHGSD